MGSVESKRLLAITILGHKKPDMPENEYHEYISKTHAGYLKELLVKNNIISYTMQHNVSSDRDLMLGQLYSNKLPQSSVADCDAIIQIVFKDMEDYLRVRADPHFLNIVNPDHANFADPSKTRITIGWFEEHIAGGQVIS